MNRDYKCRYGSSCSIGRNAENLKQVCQACRFNQCITAGMKLDCELDTVFVMIAVICVFFSVQIFSSHQNYY